MTEDSLLVCSFCGTEAAIEEVDYSPEGFWCDICDGFTYFDERQAGHTFKLILEDVTGKGDRPHGGYGISFNKRLSPLRYPDGKGRLVNYIYSRLNSEKIRCFCRAFLWRSCRWVGFA